MITISSNNNIEKSCVIKSFFERTAKYIFQIPDSSLRHWNNRGDSNSSFNDCCTTRYLIVYNSAFPNCLSLLSVVQRLLTPKRRRKANDIRNGASDARLYTCPSTQYLPFFILRSNLQKWFFIYYSLLFIIKRRVGFVFQT